MLILLLVAATVEVPASSFRMGSDRAPDETPAHEVSLLGFGIDTTEVSIGEYEAFVAAGAYATPAWWSEAGRLWLEEHPGGQGPALRASGRTPDHPVVAVTWYEADAYCRWKGGALPTEAQWEQAACGGRGTRYAWGDDETRLAAWFTEGKTGQLTGVHTRAVAEEDAGTRAPNGLMHTAGNVWEWTADAYHSRFYEDSPQADPRNTAETPWRTLRGGAFDNLPSYCTCTHREPALPAQPRLTAGFRCAYPGAGP